VRLIHELRRRHVFRVAAGYVALSWLAIQIAETVFPAFGLADYVRVVVLVAAIGFIPVLAFAWVFELTPEGFRRDREVDRDSDAVRRLDKRLDRIAIVILALAVGYFAFDKFVLDPARDEAFRQAMLGEAESRDAPGPRLGDAVLVTDFPGSHTQPTLAPDGGRMAFVSPDEHGVPQIWVMSLPDGEPVQITRGEAPVAAPSWSPTDDSILFQRGAGEQGQSIWLVDALGARPPRLIAPGGLSPRFAPDGRAFVFRRGLNEIFMGYVDGTQPRPVEGIPDKAGFARPMPAVNAAGDIVFVLAEEGPVGDLWLYEAASGEFRQLTRSDNDWAGVGAESPAWLPDGRVVIYAAPDGDYANVHLWRMDTGTGTAQVLSAGPGGYASPSISADGSRLVYAHSRPAWQLVATDAATGQDRIVYDSRRPIILPVVSPDGRSVVYFGEDGIYTAPVAGGKAEQRTFGKPAEATLPTWSASDQSIWYYKGRSLHRLVPDTGLSELVEEDFHWSEKNWLAVHGDLLAYQLRGARRTVILDLASGDETSLAEHVLPAEWSRDGRRLLARRHSDSAVVICTGPQFRCEPVLEAGAPVAGALPRWSADETRVFFRQARRDKPGYAEIWSMPAAGGETRLEAEIGPYEPRSMYFDIAEGDVIVWNRFEPAGISEIWMSDGPGLR
jgi:Tol biopolymer transport system component